MENKFYLSFQSKKRLMELLKQNVGVDVDSKTLKVSLQFLLKDLSIKIKGSRTFENTLKGFAALQQWINQKRNADCQMHLTLESTGVYYENLVYYFHDNSSFVIHVVLPNVARHYLDSLHLKSKTDKIDAKGLGQMGLERQLQPWQPISNQMRNLKKVNRERLRLTKEKTMILNQLHAEKASYQPSKVIVKRYEKRIAFIGQQLKEIEQELKATVAKDPLLKQRVDNACTAKGLGFTTVCGVVAEMNGFLLFKNRNQIVSYCGYDVVEISSGTSIHKTRKISKKGNAYIRQMMYMSAMSAAVHDEHHKAYYSRIVARTGIKKKGNVAIQRKLLLLIYALFKNNVPYDPQYHLKVRQRIQKTKNVDIIRTPNKEPVLDFS